MSPWALGATLNQRPRGTWLAGRWGRGPGLCLPLAGGDRLLSLTRILGKPYPGRDEDMWEGSRGGGACLRIFPGRDELGVALG